jgi:hypothetical protein
VLTKSFDEKNHPWKKVEQDFDHISQNVYSSCDTPLEPPKATLFNSFVECDLIENWFDYLEFLEISNKKDFRNKFQQSIFSIMNQYKDFYFPYRTIENETSIIEAYTLHAINHLLK